MDSVNGTIVSTISLCSSGLCLFWPLGHLLGVIVLLGSCSIPETLGSNNQALTLTAGEDLQKHVCVSQP